MKTVQLTHHDLDGYGASTVVGTYAHVGRVVHIARYSDVGPVVEAELARLKRSAAAEMLIMTDLGLEAPTVSFIKEVMAMNAARAPTPRHRLIVLDHHASSIGQLAAQGLRPGPRADEAWPHLKRYELNDAASVVPRRREPLRDPDGERSSRPVGIKAADEDAAPALSVLVKAIDAVDLWAKERPDLPAGARARRGLLGQCVRLHSARPSLARAVHRPAAARDGHALGRRRGPVRIERETGALRARVIDDMLPGSRATIGTRPLGCA